MGGGNGGNGGRGGGGVGSSLGSRPTSEYFEESRLSFMGSWKQRCRAVFKALLENPPPPDLTLQTRLAEIRREVALASQTSYLPGEDKGAGRGGAGEGGGAVNGQGTGVCGSTAAAPSGASILHIDANCFFLSVALRDRPDLLYDTPTACVTGSINTSEVCSANYVARGYGVKAGTFVRSARQVCPHMTLVPTSAELYVEVAAVSHVIYEILFQVTKSIEPLSCDEMFLRLLPADGLGDGVEAARAIRQCIHARTKCEVSIGIGPTTVVARFATRRAKPMSVVPSDVGGGGGGGGRGSGGGGDFMFDNDGGGYGNDDDEDDEDNEDGGDGWGGGETAGQVSSSSSSSSSSASAPSSAICAFEGTGAEEGTGVYTIGTDQVDAVLASVHVRELNGIGGKTAARLAASRHFSPVHTCAQAANVTTPQLQAEFGPVKGQQVAAILSGVGTEDSMLWDATAVVNLLPKSIQNEMNFGISWPTGKEGVLMAKNKIKAITNMSTIRLKKASCQCQHVALKFMVRHPDAEVASKVGGHGWCNNWSKSRRLDRKTDDAREIISAAMKLFAAWGGACDQLRGVGISLTVLTAAPSKKTPAGAPAAVSSSLFGNRVSESGASSEVGVARRTSGACAGAERSVCGAERSVCGAERSKG